MKPVWILPALLTWATLGAAAERGGDLATLVDQLLVKEVAARHFECGTVTVVGGGGILLERGYGACGPEGMPVDPTTTVFRAASTSKVFAAVAAVQLAERRTLRLDADVREYLPGVPLVNPSDTPLTTANLLTHTSGIEPRMLGALALTAARGKPLDAFFRDRGVRLTREPGRLISYSNLGIALAGLIVERVSQTSYEHYVEENIFAPLGMTSSSFRQPLPADLDARLVRERRGEAPILIPYPAGSMAGTAHDMGIFLRALLNGGGPILSPESVELLLAPHWRAHPNAPGVAYGFFETFHNGLRALHHTGDGGHHSLLLLVPERDVGLYFVAVTDDERAIPLRQEIARVALDALAPSSANDAAAESMPATGDASAFNGVWRGVDRVESSIEKVFSLPDQGYVAANPDGSLHISSFGGAISERLAPLANDLFRGSDGGFYSFRRDAAGYPDALTISGEVADPVTFRRGGPIEDARLQVGIVGFFGLAVSSIPLLKLSRRLRRPRVRENSGKARSADRILSLAATIAFLGPVVVIGGTFLNRPPYDRLPAQVIAGLVMLHALAAITVLQAYFAVRAWRERWWGRAYRTYYSVVSAAGLAFTAFLLYWNLLGPRL